MLFNLSYERTGKYFLEWANHKLTIELCRAEPSQEEGGGGGVPN